MADDGMGSPDDGDQALPDARLRRAEPAPPAAANGSGEEALSYTAVPAAQTAPYAPQSTAVQVTAGPEDPLLPEAYLGDSSEENCFPEAYHFDGPEDSLLHEAYLADGPKGPLFPASYTDKNNQIKVTAGPEDPLLPEAYLRDSSEENCFPEAYHFDGPEDSLLPEAYLVDGPKGPLFPASYTEKNNQIKVTAGPEDPLLPEAYLGDSSESNLNGNDKTVDDLNNHLAVCYDLIDGYRDAIHSLKQQSRAKAVQNHRKIRVVRHDVKLCKQLQSKLHMDAMSFGHEIRELVHEMRKVVGSAHDYANQVVLSGGIPVPSPAYLDWRRDPYLR